MATYTKEAKRTLYKGSVFDSATEARWAHFFDRCGIKWEHLPEIKGAEFQVDFRCRSSNATALVEVKGPMPDHADLDRLRLLTNVADEAVLLLVGTPSEHNGKAPTVFAQVSGVSMECALLGVASIFGVAKDVANKAYIADKVVYRGRSSGELITVGTENDERRVSPPLQPTTPADLGLELHSVGRLHPRFVLREDLRSRVRVARSMLEFSAKRFAESHGMAHTLVSQIERGHPYGIKWFQQYLSALGWSSFRDAPLLEEGR